MPSRSLALLPLLAVACAEPLTTSALEEPLPPLAPASAMAVVQQAPGESGTVRWTVRVLARDLVLGAYQGEVTYPAEAYEVVSVSTPEEDGATRLVNSGDSGRIRFAAYALEAFGSDVVFTAVMRERQGGVGTGVHAMLDVAGTPAGDALAYSQLSGSRGLLR